MRVQIILLFRFPVSTRTICDLENVSQAVMRGHKTAHHIYKLESKGIQSMAGTRDTNRNSTDHAVHIRDSFVRFGLFNLCVLIVLMGVVLIASFEHARTVPQHVPVEQFPHESPEKLACFCHVSPLVRNMCSVNVPFVIFCQGDYEGMFLWPVLTADEVTKGVN